MNPTSPELSVRPLTSEQASDIFALATRCPESAQWAESGYCGIGSNSLEGWGAFQDATLKGFMIVRSAADEMEILNLAVDPASRRLGIASLLFATVLASDTGNSARRIFLEVRDSNMAARSFYLSFGFVIAGTRARYYSDPVEDALVLVRKAQ